MPRKSPGTSPKCWTASSTGGPLPIEDYDLDVARAHGELLAHASRSGRRRGAHDLVIAATARARGRIVVTADQGGFDDLPGVAVRLVPRSTRER